VNPYKFPNHIYGWVEGGEADHECLQWFKVLAGQAIFPKFPLCDGPRSRITIAVAPAAMSVSAQQNLKKSPRL